MLVKPWPIKLPRASISWYRHSSTTTAPTLSSIAGVYKKSFPDDQRINSSFQEVIALNKKFPENISIGVVYENDTVRQNSKVIESILADPLAAGNHSWYQGIVDRDRLVNNKFAYYENAMSERNIYSVPSPILSYKLLPVYKQIVGDNHQYSDQEIFNNVQIVELNDLSDFAPTFHYYIYVTGDLLNPIRVPQEIKDQILITVIDSEDFTPKSNELTILQFDESVKSHIIKINSRLSFAGIDEFLSHGAKGASKYVQDVENSNIFELLKLTYYYLNSGVLKKWIIEGALDNLKANLHKVNSGDYNNIKNKDIQQFSQSIHSELQNDFIPQTNEFFKTIRWWKLYLKNDNIEYDVKDYFNKNFMNKSIENYNYYRGIIVSKLQQNQGTYSVDPIDNPIFSYKDKLINEKIENEVQPVIYASLVENFSYYQLPLSIIAFLSYQYFGFQPESATALAALGWVIGFNNVSHKWEKFSQKWLNGVYEDVRVILGKSCIENGLLKELNVTYEQELELIKIKEQAIEALQKQLQNSGGAKGRY